ncbi:hypothetical protein SBA1_30066 [Candidatus Sulfotelmatobacter kueseliae]|uniref:Uncharacterized protein n=1 Tax=Candidatus Sulfotelmatobacter kueseliae TaxID=2042962 RepID=A0A2U3KKQ1_9BACT|nr:hypothetical protein SBA1_30066 [Candidatus Sulfotelmatobacter kueseliae]
MALNRQCGSFPGELVVEVIARREEAIPRFLEILEYLDKRCAVPLRKNSAFALEGETLR